MDDANVSAGLFKHASILYDASEASIAFLSTVQLSIEIMSSTLDGVPLLTFKCYSTMTTALSVARYTFSWTESLSSCDFAKSFNLVCLAKFDQVFQICDKILSQHIVRNVFFST